MSRFRNATTGVVVRVDDSKDGRFGKGWKPVGDSADAEPADEKKSK